MSDVSIDDLKEKIKRVETDIQKLHSESGSVEAVSILESYKEYLQDELKEAESKKR